MKFVVAIALMLVLISGNTVQAQSVYPDRPMQLRVTGTLLPVEEQKREDIVAIPVFVQDKALTLRLGKVEDLNPSGRGDPIKEDVLMRQVRFYGSEDLLTRLQAGKVLTIEGQLDPKERRFRVTGVQEGSAAAPAK
jgi:hypothetical protein